jgi:hypothetical protein
MPDRLVGPHQNRVRHQLGDRPGSSTTRSKGSTSTTADFAVAVIEAIPVGADLTRHPTNCWVETTPMTRRLTRTKAVTGSSSAGGRAHPRGGVMLIVHRCLDCGHPDVWGQRDQHPVLGLAAGLPKDCGQTDQCPPQGCRWNPQPETMTRFDPAGHPVADVLPPGSPRRRG